MAQDLTVTEPDRLKRIEDLLSSAIKLRDPTTVEAQAEERLRRIDRLLEKLAMTCNAMDSTEHSFWGMRHKAQEVIDNGTKIATMLTAITKDFKKAARELRTAQLSDARTRRAARTKKDKRKKGKY